MRCHSVLVKEMDKLGAEYYRSFENIDGAECKTQREMGKGRRRHCLSERTCVVSLMLFTPWFSLIFSGDVLVLGDLAEMMFYHSNPLQDGSLKFSTRIKGTVDSTPWSLEDTWHEKLMVLVLMDVVHVDPHQWVLPAYFLPQVVTGVMNGTLLYGAVVNVHDVSTCANILEDLMRYTFRAVWDIVYVNSFGIFLLELHIFKHADNSCDVALSLPHVSLMGFVMVYVIREEEYMFTCSLWAHKHIFCLLQSFTKFGAALMLEDIAICVRERFQIYLLHRRRNAVNSGVS